MIRGLEPEAAAAWAIGRAIFYASTPNRCAHGVRFGLPCFRCQDLMRWFLRVFGPRATASHDVDLSRRASRYGYGLVRYPIHIDPV